jgi:hypothetical protein
MLFAIAPARFNAEAELAEAIQRLHRNIDDRLFAIGFGPCCPTCGLRLRQSAFEALRRIGITVDTTGVHPVRV